MSRPRPGSPSYRRFPWEEPDFDPHKVLAELDGNPSDRSHRPRGEPEEHWDYSREDMYPEGHRRSPPFPDDHQFVHHRHPNQEEFYRRRPPSPHLDVMGFDDDRRLSPLHGGEVEGDRRREGFKELFQRFENRARLPQSPLRISRERLPPTPKSHSDHQQREPGIGWKREEQGRGRGRFRDQSPNARLDDQRGGAGRERGRRSTQGPNRDRRREDSHHERTPPFKRQRRQMDDAAHLGSLCYSSDRQLSLDLVNVGRQRLDFLPMLEHSGTYRENAMHTGTFAQEIITLVHQVKEQYFRNDGATLNERFSAPQQGGYSEEETEELTLDERFSSNRGFSLNMNSLLDDDEPLFSRLGPLQPVRDPGDLRHDLERRRQERLEGVKVTISGNNMSPHPLGPISAPGLAYRDKDEMSQMEDEGFSTWPEEQSRRREGNMGPRRGAPYRPNAASQRRNTRPVNRLGPMRRPNNRNTTAGPNW
uniref:BCLAF1 and THRAP3 family member 3 n=1 Tax=Sander lucioperca TaxID=283035 RepID=A0A8D0AWK6_SANLU